MTTDYNAILNYGDSAAGLRIDSPLSVGFVETPLGTEVVVDTGESMLYFIAVANDDGLARIVFDDDGPREREDDE